ncbi:sigma 54-interacting transcriptional regulator [Thermanaeromonas toyohensis]|uniref:sigma 54-interacting transcriptional regulator n=1 Tax=Thermanaeromonas toyohensis TaxID=161154 RepID=UPI001560EC28|nr:sigma 54-interacting transcriptional regulator [Thermanaeromonas toyohensis]
MKEKKWELKQLILKEDKKNPLPDEALAEILRLPRCEVTMLRQELGIPDSRERRKPLLLKSIKNILQTNPHLSERKITQALREEGFRISRSTVSLLLKEINNLEEGSPSPILPTPIHPGLSFTHFIGYEGSLKPAIEKAKAAILYPPHGLHTLLIGPTGVGKSELALAMYNFAVESGRLSPGAPFVTFNCADYAHNPQLLVSQLFGYVKGAFTGAEKNKSGLIEKAHGGILFLDEIHRLPPEGQEILFQVIDKGKFRRLGETEYEHEIKVLLIGATTENIHSYLLSAFKRRIPMIIELPSLAQRPLSERLALIKAFFLREAEVINLPFEIKPEVFYAFLFYDCPGNIGQLASDIKTCCASAYLRYISGVNKTIKITYYELPQVVKEGLKKLSTLETDLEELDITETVVLPSRLKEKTTPSPEVYQGTREIYDYIENRFQELLSQGLSVNDINQQITKEIELKFSSWAKWVTKRKTALSEDELKKLASPEIIDICQKLIRIAQQELGPLDPHILIALSLHIEEALKRRASLKLKADFSLAHIKEKYPLEYEVARKLAVYFQEISGTALPPEEIGFLTLYLQIFKEKRPEQGKKVGILVLSHGQVAPAMAEVANNLLGVCHAKGLVALQEDSQVFLEKLAQTIREIDEGKGVLVLADTQALGEMAQVAGLRAGVPVKNIIPATTMLTIEATRRALLPEMDLEKLASSLSSPNLVLEQPPAILTVCLTGQGGAMLLKREIKNRLPEIERAIEIIPISYLGETPFEARLKEIRQKRRVVAIMGTIDPQIKDIPFIPAFSLTRSELNVKLSPLTKKEIGLDEAMHEDLIYLWQGEVNKPQAIELLFQGLREWGAVLPEFLTDVLKRELLSPAILLPQVAIPHGSPENVLKPAIAIAISQIPIEWGEGQMVKIICMLALTVDNAHLVLKLRHKLEKQAIFNRLLHAPTAKAVKEVLTSDQSI